MEPLEELGVKGGGLGEAVSALRQREAGRTASRRPAAGGEATPSLVGQGYGGESARHG